MFLVVGLGNPGSKYAGTRHNVGSLALSHFAEKHRTVSFRDQFSGLYAQASWEGHSIGLLAPQTYMNRSGFSVRAALHFFKVPIHQLIVLHDELDLPFGVNRVKSGGGVAGHNGVSSIVEQCGTNQFIRIRIGIGRPKNAGEVTHYVLGNFTPEEKSSLTGVLSLVAGAVEIVIQEGVQEAMNRINRKGESKQKDKVE